MCAVIEIYIEWGDALLQDPQGRQFHYLRLSITDVCNFRCQYCLPDGYSSSHDKPQALNIDEIKTLVRGFAELGTTKVRITGGEPTLRQDLAEIVSEVRQINGINTIAMTSHGERLFRLTEPLKQAGLDQVNVSIDSLDPRQFALITGKDRLQQIMRGIDKALESGLDVKVNTVLMSDFSDIRLFEFLKWLKYKPVTLRFIELMQTGDNSVFFHQQHQSGQWIKHYLESQGWHRLTRALDAGPALEYHHPDYEGKIGLILPYSKDFCASCNRLRVNASGDLHLCLFSENGIPLRDTLGTSDTRALKARLTETLMLKRDSHFLHDNQTGATKHLAMLGG